MTEAAEAIIWLAGVVAIAGISITLSLLAVVFAIRASS